MSEVHDLRPSPLAGQWYPANPNQLAAQVDQYMEAARLPELDGDVVAIVAPHAGYLYSGPVAGYAFAAVRGLAADVVVVASPMHQPYYEALLTTKHDAYATPLGAIPVHREALGALDSYLMEELNLTLTPVTRDREHSLEIELPFLQRALAKPFSLVPIMLRDQSSAIARGLGKALAHLIGQGGLLADQTVILVASTDLSHFYPQQVANKLDAEILRQVEAFDPAGVIRTDELGKGYACGRGALAAVLWAAKELGADRAQVLHHATSGDVTGDHDSVVGYGAAVITRH
ncbi:MAG: AmmeMemoRadiSam system protein B [Anaerolineales bacterium]|nr:AmmeMemoRadiSam system protein B [Anaerolineales bacterium]